MFAYVGSRTTRERNARGNGINVYRVDPINGEWTHTQHVDGLVNPSFLAFGKDQRFLYTVHGDCSEVSAFNVNPENGSLTLINSQSTNGKNPVHLVADASYRYLAVANYGSGTVALLSLNVDGSLGEVVDLVEVPGTQGPHRVEQPHARPHHIPFDPSGRFLIVPDKGVDRIFTFSLDTARGRLVLHDAPAKARETSGPRHIAFHPTKPFGYVVNELDSTVTTYQFAADSGTLTPMQISSTLPATFTGDSRASEIAIAPSGQFAYASNRGYDSIAIFAVDQQTGMLSIVGWVPSLGKTPRFFAIEPAARFLYVANEDSDTIVAFRIANGEGTLQPTGHVVNVGSPVCIIFSSRRT